MEPMLAQFAEVAHSVDYTAPTLRVLSEGDVTDPEHWVRHVRATVRFHQLATGLRERGARTLLEIGPDAALTSVIDVPGCTAIPTQRRSHPEDAALADALAQLHVRGVDPDWAAYFDGTGARRIDLPTYPFQHRRYWPVTPDRTPTGVTTAGLVSADHPLLGAAVELADTDGILFTARLAWNTHRWLTDHVVSGQVLLPGTAFLELAVRAGEQAGCPMVREFTLASPLPLPEHGAVALQVWVSAPDDTDHRTITLYSRHEPDGDTGAGDTPWTLHATGVLGPDRAEGQRFAQWPPSGAVAVDIEEFYPRFAELGFDHGPVFRGLRSVWRAGSDIYAEVALDETTADTAGRFAVHPALLDAALHAVAFVSLGDAERGRLPFSWQGATVHAGGASALRVRLSPVGADAVSMTATDPTGAPVLTVESLLLRQMSDTPPAGRHPATDGLYEMDWIPAPTPGTNGDDDAPVSWALLGDDPFELSAPGGLADAGEHPAPEVLVRCLGPGQGVREALGVVQEFLGSGTLGSARLAVVTGDPTTEPDVAAVWGLVRSAEVENPGHFLLIGLDQAAVGGTATPGSGRGAGFGQALSTAVSAGEPQLLVRAGVVHVARLVRAGGADIPVPARGPWRLHLDERGSLDNLVAVPAESTPLSPGQVRIGVRAAGVNFRDVLTALDMYPGEAPLLGTEVAGILTELAPDVTGLAVGDRVMGMAFGGFGPQVVTDRRLLTRIPPDWTFAQAAAAPTAFLTAFYALVDLGRVRPGERVLIHAAAGGVGMAASQIARHLGARLFGTASPAKWAATGLAEDHLASSRDTGFAAAFGQVDVVLNSLAGPFIDASLGMLGDGGRFLEMGKTDIRDTTPDGVDYRPFDLWDAGVDRIGQILAELSGLFASGVLQPLPLRSWDVRRARDAFRHISQARHIGKVVLTIPAPLDPERPILITGGTGALGMELAHHLVTERGARRTVLTSRRGPQAPGTAASVAALAHAGASVEVLACDVTDHDQLAAVLAERDWTAIVHTAGVLADATLPTQTHESLDTALAPKIHAATHLDHLTRHHDLAVFAVYSSVAGTLGSAGQANYAAANAALDALATRRRAAGLPATSLAWGPWTPTSGMTATLTSTHRTRLANTGLRPIEPRRGAELFEAGVGGSAPTVVVADVDRSALRRWGPPHLWRNVVEATPRRVTARPGANTGANTGDTAGGLRERLAGLSGEDRQQLLLDVVCEQVAAVLGHESAASVDPDRPFSELGFDSLTAVELRNRLGALTGERLPATLVFNHPRPTALAGYLGTEVLPEPSSTGGEGPGRDAVTAPPELARVAAALADPSRRASVFAGLRDLLERWTDPGERGGAEATTPGATGSDHDEDGALEAATPDDIFDLVDRELRKS
jgi:NADPH:quinone reductase-like Zn-dependent oxidoreductase